VIIGFMAVAAAQSITLGAGRIAVLDPGVPATSITSSAPSTVDVVSTPTSLLVIGLAAGTATVTIESSSGPRTWGVRVDGNGSVAPSGGPGLAPVGDTLALPMGSGVLCTIPGASTFTRIDEPFAQVFPFGASRWFVQLDKTGTQDIAFEMAKGKPRVLTLTPAPIGAAAPSLPTGCARPTETVNLVVGEEMDVVVGRRVKTLLVGSPSLVYAAPTEGATDRVHLAAIKPGTTTILARATDNEDPWMRTVVVARAP
jgi:Flp pilus assembly secretin CpaC